MDKLPYLRGNSGEPEEDCVEESSEEEGCTGPAFEYAEKLELMSEDDKLREWFKRSESMLKSFKVRSLRDAEMIEMTEKLCRMTSAMAKDVSSVFEYKIERAAEVNYATRTACFSTEIAQGIDTLNDLCTMVYDHYFDTNRKCPGGKLFSQTSSSDHEFNSKDDYGIECKSQKLIQMMSLTKKQGYSANGIAYNNPSDCDEPFRDSLDLSASSYVKVINSIVTSDSSQDVASSAIVPLKFADAFPIVQQMLDLNVQQGYIKPGIGGKYSLKAETSKKKGSGEYKRYLVAHTALIFETICCFRYSVVDGEEEGKKDSDFLVKGEKSEIVPFLREISGSFPESNQMLAALMLGLNSDPNLLSTKEAQAVLNLPQHFGNTYMGKKDSKTGPPSEGVGCLVRILCVIARAQIAFGTLVYEAIQVEAHLNQLESKHPGQFTENIKLHEQLVVVGKWLTSWRGDEDDRNIHQLVTDIGIHLCSSTFAQALTGLMEENRTPDRSDSESPKANKGSHAKRFEDIELKVIHQEKKLEWLEKQVKVLSADRGIAFPVLEQLSSEPKTDEYVHFVEAANQKLAYDTYSTCFRLREDYDYEFPEALAEKFEEKYPDHPLIVISEEEWEAEEAKRVEAEANKQNESESASAQDSWKNIKIIAFSDELESLKYPEQRIIQEVLGEWNPKENKWEEKEWELLTHDIKLSHTFEDGTVSESELVDPKVTKLSPDRKETIDIMKKHYPHFGIPAEFHLDDYTQLSQTQLKIREFRESVGSGSGEQVPIVPRIAKDVYDRNSRRWYYLTGNISPCSFKEVKKEKGTKKKASTKHGNSFLADDTESSFEKVLPLADNSDRAIVINSSKSQSEEENVYRANNKEQDEDGKPSATGGCAKADEDEAQEEADSQVEESSDDDSSHGWSSIGSKEVPYSPLPSEEEEETTLETPIKDSRKEVVMPNSEESIAKRKPKRKARAKTPPKKPVTDSQSPLDFGDDQDDRDKDYVDGTARRKKRVRDRTTTEDGNKGTEAAEE